MLLKENQIRISPAVDTTGRILVQYPDGTNEKVKEGLYIIRSGKLYPVRNDLCDIVVSEFDNYGKDFEPFTSHFISIENEYNSETNTFELYIKYQDITESFTAEYYAENEEYKYQLLTVTLKPAALC